MNPHEELRRARKVTALVAEIDRQALLRGVHPQTEAGAGRLVNMLGTWTTDHWARISLLAGTHPPSAASRTEVIATYARRAMPARKAS